MNRRDRRRNRSLLAKGGKPARIGQKTSQSRPVRLSQLSRAERKALLLGTALVTASLGGVAPSPVAAQVLCTQAPSPAPISDLNVADALICVNTETRINNSGNAIDLSTTAANPGSYIYVNNSGYLRGVGVIGATGLSTATDAENSFITIENSGDVVGVLGITSQAYGAATGPSGDSGIVITNTGEIDASNAGILALTQGNADGADSNKRTFIDNRNTVTVSSLIGASIVGTSGGNAAGDRSDAGVTILNSGDLSAAQTINASVSGSALGDDSTVALVVDNSGRLITATTGINAVSVGDASGARSDARVQVGNSAAMDVLSPVNGAGIFAVTTGDATNNSTAAVAVANSGDLNVAANGESQGINAQALGQASNSSNAGVAILNSGILDIAGQAGYGIRVISSGDATNNSDKGVGIGNVGFIEVDAEGAGYGIIAIVSGSATDNSNARVSIGNTGDMDVDADGAGYGIHAVGGAPATNNSIAGTFVANSGALNIEAGDEGYGLSARSTGDATNESFTGVTVLNSGALTVDADESAYGVRASTGGNAGDNSDSGIRIVNFGEFDITSGADGYGIRAGTEGDADDGSFSGIVIQNSGDFYVEGSDNGYGIRATTIGGATNGSNAGVRIVNSGNFDVEAGPLGVPVGYGIRAATGGGSDADAGSFAGVEVGNSGHFRVEADSDGVGIGARSRGDATDGSNAGITIGNSGDMDVDAGDEGTGIRAVSEGDATGGSNAGVVIDNSGDFDIAAAVNGYGIRAETEGDADATSFTGVVVRNSGDFRVLADPATGNNARGISVQTSGDNAPALVDNRGALHAAGVEQASAIEVRTDGYGSTIAIKNSGRLLAGTSPTGPTEEARGINAETSVENSRIDIANSGKVDVLALGLGDPGAADAIRAYAEASDSPISIHNSGNLRAVSLGGYVGADGIDVDTRGYTSPIDIWNSGDIRVETRGNRSGADGIEADTDEKDSPVTVRNSGDIRIDVSGDYSNTDGIDPDSNGENSPITVHNSGNIWLKTTGDSSSLDGINPSSEGLNSSVTVYNSGDIWTETRGYAADSEGIDAYADKDNSPITIHNSGDITVKSFGDGNDNTSDPYFSSTEVTGIEAATGGQDQPDDPRRGLNSSITIVNFGDIHAASHGDNVDSFGMNAFTRGDKAEIEIHNGGDILAEAKGKSVARGIEATTEGVDSPIDIHNSGSIYAKGGAENTGIFASSAYNNETTIANTGSIGAESHRAIDVKGAGTAHIDNAGTITGFVDLTGQDDVFKNEFGGVFEAKQTSLFGEGDDLFDNERGGTVQAATNGKKSETTRFEGLETFKNEGTISMRDNRAGDRFIVSNTPGGTDLDYKGDHGTLAVDSFLGGAGSKSDLFVIDGNVSGKTFVDVFNTNPNSGAFNSEGIPVVIASGDTPDENAFRLANGPIDAGFFDYDLFFEETNSGQWELRSFPGAGAHLLPQLLTAAQDLWHQSSNTWFDRTADLRVVLNSEGVLVPTGDKTLAAPVEPKFTPAAWLKTGGQFLDRDANAQTKAYGRTYNYNLDRELESFDLQAGIDFGSRGVLGAGDALVFGVLGGFIYGDLSYDNLARTFDYSGGQVGAYATYLNGGLFVDTLLNVHIYDIDASTRGFPGAVDGNTVGLRTDTGYRFGSFTGGMFIEPLATLEVMWVDLDGFSNGGNRVSFSDDANIRGRLGLRAGTTGQFTESVLWEPFVIGSVWGNLDDSNSATVVSAGRTFNFVDDPEDVWGEVSAGVNFFNLSKSISVFSKIDVSFGDDLTGVGGQGGMRVAW